MIAFPLVSFAVLRDILKGRCEGVLLHLPTKIFGSIGKISEPAINQILSEGSSEEDWRKIVGALKFANTHKWRDRKGDLWSVTPHYSERRSIALSSQSLHVTADPREAGGGGSWIPSNFKPKKSLINVAFPSLTISKSLGRGFLQSPLTRWHLRRSLMSPPPIV